MHVSFIIPVYNVEKYLDKCVQSILEQTYNDFEILLVDDGSSDRSPELCDRWSSLDKRVTSLHKANGGLSDARNYGLRYAKGKYVVFVDSDDFWCHSHSLQKLINIIEKYPESDFIGFNCQYYYADQDSYTKWVPYSEILASPVTGDKAIQILVQSGTLPMSACLKLLKRSMLIDNCLTFKKGQIAEDIPWFINLMEKSTNCIFINEYIYAYRQNVDGSITSSAGLRSFNSLLDILITEIQKMNSRSFSEFTKHALYSFWAYEFCILLASVSGISKEKYKLLLEYKWLLNYTENPKVRKVSLINKLFGIKVTEYVLKFYIKHIRK